MSSGRYMAYSPSPSTTPHSPRISGLRASSAAVADQEKYLAELLAERHKLNPFVPVLPHSIRLLNQEIIRVSTLLENASLLNQSGFEHGSPLTSGGLYSNGAATDMNGWTSAFQSEAEGSKDATKIFSLLQLLEFGQHANTNPLIRHHMPKL